jgi:hypothetical protein
VGACGWRRAAGSREDEGEEEGDHVAVRPLGGSRGQRTPAVAGGPRAHRTGAHTPRARAGTKEAARKRPSAGCFF